MVDAGAPVVAVRATDVGVRGDEDIATLDAVPGLLARLDAVRREAGVRMGLAETPETVARAVPKLALVSDAVSDDAPESDLTVRMLSMGRFHPAVPVTGSVALTLAAGTAGTVVHDLVAPDGPVDGPVLGLRLATPAGCVSTCPNRRSSHRLERDHPTPCPTP
jgi:2-methylaconitate cis-trans-isomerase PrpF